MDHLPLQAIGRISNWASDLFFPEGREGSRPGSQERRSHETLAARISQAGRQVLEADRSSEGWTFVAPSPAPLLSREAAARTPQTLPAISVAAKKAKSRKRQAWNFEDDHYGHGGHGGGGHGGHGLTAASAKTDLPNDGHGQDMSLLSVLQKRHQTLPSAEIGGAPEPGEVKSPRRFQGRRSLTAGPARLSGGRTVPKMNVKQFLELLEAQEKRPNSSGRPDGDPKRQEYVFLENLVPPGAHVSVAKMRGADEKEIVLKTIRKGWFVTSEDEEQWFICNRQLQSLDAPSLCQVLGLWKEDDSYQLVMELVPGMDIFTMLKAEGAFPPDTARQITKDILEALAVLHGQQLIHRDIKLQNIMAQRCPLSGEIKVKIINYDMLWPMCGAKATSRFVVGSDQYIAPEAYDAHYSVASDLFAVGVVCFALCFGRFPFSSKVFDAKDDEPGQNLVGSRKMKEIGQRLRNATIKWPDGPKEDQAADFCRWLLDMNPKNRPSDASEALRHPFLRLR